MHASVKTRKMACKRGLHSASWESGASHVRKLSMSTLLCIHQCCLATVAFGAQVCPMLQLLLDDGELAVDGGDNQGGAARFVARVCGNITYVSR